MTTQSDSTVTGESLETKPSSDLSVDGAAELFLKRLTDAKKPSDSAKDEDDKTSDKGEATDGDAVEPTTDDQKQDESTDADAESAVDDKPKGDEKVTYADDNAKVKVQVDGKDHEFSVKDLKRLAGQEKAITQRSQAVAETEKQWKADNERNQVALKTLGERAYKAYEPYAKIDWPLMAAQLSAEDYKALKQDASEAEGNLRYIAEELDGAVKAASTKTADQLKEAGKACSAAINDPKGKHHIPGWSKETYEVIRTFAIDAGIPADTANTITDPALYKVLHEAMTFRKEKAARTQAITKAKNKVVSDKTLRPASTTGDGSAAPRDKAAFQRLNVTGSLDDAAAVFEARLKAKRD